jgi:hypothetical protein
MASAHAWPFDQPRNCAVFTTRQVLEGAEPILHVTHDSDDHGWQFLGGEAREDQLAARNVAWTSESRILLQLLELFAQARAEAVSPNTRRRPSPNRHTAFYGTGPETRRRPDGGASSLEPAPLRASSSWPGGISPPGGLSLAFGIVFRAL